MVSGPNTTTNVAYGVYKNVLTTSNLAYNVEQRYGVWDTAYGVMNDLISTSPPHRPGGGTTVIYETPSEVIADSSPDTGQDTSYDVVQNVPPHEVQR